MLPLEEQEKELEELYKEIHRLEIELYENKKGYIKKINIPNINWHLWYAWRPVRIGLREFGGYIVWRIWIERRYMKSRGIYQYRFLDPKINKDIVFLKE